MKKSIFLVLCLILGCVLAGCHSEKTSEDVNIDGSSLSATESTQSTSQSAEEITAQVSDSREIVDKKIEQIKISIQIGDLTLLGELNDSALAAEFALTLPQTVSMQRVGGGREFYGRMDRSLNYNKADAQTTFENGDIAYWFSGNGLCLLYDNQVEDPEVDSGIIIIGKITSDFSELHNMSGNITVTISLAE